MRVAAIVLRHLIPALQEIEEEINETESRELAAKDSETKVHIQPLANPDRLLNVDEAAALLGLKKQTIYNYVMMRKIPFYKLGTRTLFKQRRLLEWLDGFAVDPIGSAPRRRRASA